MDGVIITNQGKQLLASLMSSNGTLKFTKVEIGTGIHEEEYNPENMEALLNYKMNGLMSKCKVKEDAAVLTLQMISPDGQEGFTATELGVFASEDREGAKEVLYAYLDMGKDPQYIYANDGGTQKIVEITLEIIIANIADVKAEIAPDSIIFRDEFAEKGEELKGLIEAETERAKSAEIKNAEDIEHIKNTFLNLTYPIGSIYTSSNPANPGTLFGGTWAQIKDTFLLTAGDAYKAGTTGGEVSHTLSVAEIPSHGHGYSGTTGNDNNDHAHTFSANTGTVSADHVHGISMDGSGEHNHQSYWRLENGGGTNKRNPVGYANSDGYTVTNNAGMHAHNAYAGGISQNHTHGVSGTTGGRNAFHQHAYSGTTAGTGSGVAHNNMPPYRVVYAWERTA